MKKVKWIAIILTFILLCGCSLQTRYGAVIDWVDFVKWNGELYTGDWDAVLMNPGAIGEEIGEVQFRVADVVTNPSYRTKNGDAAFLVIGTKLYQVEGFKKSEMLAVEDSSYPGGYKLYFTEKFREEKRITFEDLSQKPIQKIELYDGYYESKHSKTLKEKDINSFMKLLKEGVDTPGYSSNNKNGDPLEYRIVIDIGETLGYSYTLFDDSDNVFFYPWDARIVDEKIRELLK